MVRELRNVAGLLFASLLTVVVTTTLVRTLGRTAAGRVDPDLVVPLLALSTITSLPLVLALSAFIALMLVFGRMWRDSEMVVWMASGQSLLSLYRPTLQFLWPVLALILVAATAVVPWARYQSEVIQKKAEARQESRQLAPGQFRESSGGSRVLFVENPTDNSAQLGKVFVVERDRTLGSERVIMARSGELKNEAIDPNNALSPAAPMVEIRDGTRSELPAGLLSSETSGLDAKTLSFREYRLALESIPITDGITATIRAQTTAQLIIENSPAQKGELVSRFGFPLLALMLGLLAVPLAVTNPRVGRTFQFITALLVTVLANNLLSVSQSWVAQGKMTLWLGMAALPALMALVLAAMLAWQMGLDRQVQRLRGWVAGGLLGDRGAA